VASSESVKGDLKALKQPKLAQLDKELCMCCTVMHSEGKPVTCSLIIDKPKSF
jgi:hypothetical protein